MTRCGEISAGDSENASSPSQSEGQVCGQVQVRGTSCGRHRRGTRHRPGLCPDAGRPRRQRDRERPGWIHGRSGRRCRKWRPAWRPRSLPRAARPSPTAATWPRRTVRSRSSTRPSSSSGASTSSSTTPASSDGRVFPRPTVDNLERHLAVHVDRVVQHCPRRLALHGRAGLRPDRHDHLEPGCSGCRTTSPTPPPRAP